MNIDNRFSEQAFKQAYRLALWLTGLDDMAPGTGTFRVSDGRIGSG
ncbi:MAG: hypothetical protein ACR2QB_03200 [Gammaproteobacteria bacterium]